MRAAYIACMLLILTSTSLASPSHDFQAGGFFGRASTEVKNVGTCAVLFGPAPADECESYPGNGGHDGPVGGVYVRYRLRRGVYAEIDLAYVRKGYNAGNAVRLHYVEAPLVVRLDPLAERSPARVFAFAGLAPTVNIACRMYGQIFINDPPPHTEEFAGPCDDEKLVVDDTPRRFGLNSVIGVGLGWDFGFGIVEVQGRFGRSLVDVDGFVEGGKTVHDTMYVVAAVGRRL